MPVTHKADIRPSAVLYAGIILRVYGGEPEGARCDAIAGINHSEWYNVVSMRDRRFAEIPRRGAKSNLPHLAGEYIIIRKKIIENAAEIEFLGKLIGRSGVFPQRRFGRD